MNKILDMMERELKRAFTASGYEDSFATSIRQGVTVHSVHSNALRDAQKSCIRMISRRNSRVFCELCSQKTPRGTLPVNSNVKVSLFDNT